MTHEDTCNAAFRRHHMGRLLYRMGTLLPHWLNGPDLARGCRDLWSNFAGVSLGTNGSLCLTVICRRF